MSHNQIKRWEGYDMGTDEDGCWVEYDDFKKLHDAFVQAKAMLKSGASNDAIVAFMDRSETGTE